MDRASAEKSLLDQLSHFEHLERELEIMTGSYLKVLPLRQFNKGKSFLGCNGERFLEVNVTASFERLLPEGKMALRWSRYVNDVRLGALQKFAKIRKILLNTKPFGHLLSHEGFTVTNSYDLRLRNATDSRDVVIGDFAATYDRDAEWRVSGESLQREC